MKRTFGLAALAALVIGSVSCSKEIDNGAGNGAQATSAFQFSLQSAKGALVTYANIATDAEWNYGDVSVFIYDKATGALLGDNANFTVQSASGKTTLTATDAWTTANKGKTINVYFVGNNEAANLFGSTAHATDLATEADFIEQLTISQGMDGDYAKLLTTPLLFSASALDVLVPSANKVTVPVTLKRREARFDIVNPVPDDFEISKVVVRNANLQGFIFADATTTPTLATGKLKEIDCTGMTYDTDNLAGSVFYLYPTTLGVGAGTEIAVIATMKNGEPTSYPVNSSARIEANKRYKLVFDKAQLGFDVVPDDYDEGEEFAVGPMTELDFSDFTVASGTATYDHINGLVYVIPNDPASTVSFTTYASTAAGVEITATPFLGTGPAITTTDNTTESTVTYSNIGFKTTVAIEIDKYTGSESFSTVVKVKDKGSDAYDTFLVLYEDPTPSNDGEETYPTKVGDLPAVKVGDIYWAPVNVGAYLTVASIENQDLMSFKGCLFQFGRNEAAFDVTQGGGYIPDDLLSGPVTYTEGISLTNATKFISNANADWISPDDTGGKSIRNARWEAMTNDSPCPEGWRLPVKSELSSLIQDFSYIAESNRLLVTCDEEQLYFPATGYRAADGGCWGHPTSARYWTATMESSYTKIAILHIGLITPTVNMTQATPAVAAAIRCVKDVE